MVLHTATAQTANDPNAGARLTLGSTPGRGDFSWWGQPGRTYFLQRSVDLSAWEYLPLIYSGTDARLAWDFPSAESQLFLRLRSTDLPTNDPYTADFDGDQIGNWDELLQGTDPLAAADTDANGLPDDWEKFYFGQTGVDPNAAAPGGGGLTNLQHFQLGSNPNLPPPLDPLLQAPPPVTITASPATLGQSAATLLYPADDSQLLLQNGNFSAPALPTPVRWSIFGVRTDYPNGGIPGWTALSGSLIELQQIAVNPAAGAGQYCELDAHWPTSLHLGPSDHGIQQTVNLARGRYLLFFDYRGRATNARSFTVKASSGPGMIFGLPNPSLKLLASTTTASTNTWQRASVSFAVAGGDPAQAQLPITLLFDIADAADSFGAYIDNVILLPIEMIEVTPSLKDEDGVEIPNSTKPKLIPAINDMVEEPIADQIPKVAYRVLKVKVPKEVLAGEKVKWSMTPQFTPSGETEPRFRGVWPTTHPDRFEPAPTNGYGFERISQKEGRTTIDSEGFFAVRINLPPRGYNKARVKLEFEKYPGAYSEIDFEVPAVVVIDPGHGGSSDLPGSDANHAVSPTNVKEKDLALGYGLALREALKAKVHQDKLNVKVLMTRDTDVNVAGTNRAHFARDNGADAVFVIHFNSSNGSVRGTLEVRQVPSQVNLNEDFALIDPIINMIVAAITPFDSGARKLEFFPRDTSVAFDPKLGNTAGYHPIRVGYCEVEFLDNAAVDVLLNTGPNAGAAKTAIVNAMRNGILSDLKNQPAAP